MVLMMIIIFVCEGCVPNLRSLMKRFFVTDALLTAPQNFQGFFCGRGLV